MSRLISTRELSEIFGTHMPITALHLLLDPGSLTVGELRVELRKLAEKRLDLSARYDGYLVGPREDLIRDALRFYAENQSWPREDRTAQDWCHNFADALDNDTWLIETADEPGEDRAPDWPDAPLPNQRTHSDVAHMSSDNIRALADAAKGEDT